MSNIINQQEKKQIDVKIENAPSRPPTTYNLFIKEIMPILKDKFELPNKMTIASDIWGSMKIEEKEGFMIKYEELKVIYNDRLEEYRKNGYYYEEREGDKVSNKRNTSILSTKSIEIKIKLFKMTQTMEKILFFNKLKKLIMNRNLE